MATRTKVQIVGVDERFEIDHLSIAAPDEHVLAVEHVGDAAAHARREIAPRTTEHDDAPPVMYSQP
jgi:hypothetical protein